MALETKVIALTSVPVDLTADPDVRAAIMAAGSLRCTAQNISTSNGKVCIAQTATAPAAGSRDGFVLTYRDSALLTLDLAGPMWAWSPTTSKLAITSAT